jgi:hypothetical protein
VDDKFCSDAADSNGLDFVDLNLSLDGWIGQQLLVSLQL